jgi:hypothetical protein
MAPVGLELRDLARSHRRKRAAVGYAYNSVVAVSLARSATYPGELGESEIDQAVQLTGPVAEVLDEPVAESHELVKLPRDTVTPSKRFHARASARMGTKGLRCFATK